MTAESKGVRLTKGVRVQTKFGSGVIASDYWRDRDRFTVQFNDGSESDFGASALRILPVPASSADDQGMGIPDKCTLWPCAGAVKLSGQFFTCETCGASYGSEL